MKIGIMTHYGVHNHGALLQLYALRQVLQGEGNTAKALTFNKNYDFMEGGVDKKYEISWRSIPFYLSYINKIGIRRTFFNYKKKKILDRFRKSLVGEYYSRAINLDAVFIGSDEVFSIESGVNPFFFGIGLPCKKIYSYAASCGPTTIDFIREKNMTALITAGLKNMDKVSVRDANTQKIVKKLSEIKAEIVCDPVILYGFEDELKKAERKINKDYIVIYAYDNNMNEDKEIEIIKKYAKKHKLYIVSVGFYHSWCDICVDGSPIDILGYFKYAKYVITDTFHGSVISLITNANFVAKIRTNRNKLYDLLDNFDLADRIIDNFDEIEHKLPNIIDYNKTNELIELTRKSSYKYIKACLEDASHE